MPDPHYPWQRYCCARGAEFPLDQTGFLADREGEWGRYMASRLQTFPEVVNRGAVVLLGEPGLGKSDVFTAAAATRRSDSSALVLTPDLQAVNSAQQIQHLFASTAIREWTEGTSTLHLYLDSVDECTLRVDVFGKLLIELLRELPLQRLRLYLACRTTEWPELFESDLTTLLQRHAQSFDAYELAPLRRRDVELAAIVHELESDAVLSAIEHHGAVPLAIKPVTLRLLLTTFADGVFPGSQLELYDAGMRALVTESAHRRETQLAGALDAMERLAIAERIAAITTLTGRATIDATPTVEQPATSVVATWEIAEGYEHVHDRELPVTEQAIAEVLDTGLFSLRGERRLGWAHQTYSEYLAAQYLRERHLTTAQVTSLLQASDGRVIPQLHGVAAWIAAVSPDHFGVVAATDPQILVASDVVLPADDQKRELVDHLLRRTSEGLRLDVFHARKLAKLAHPHLRDQIRPFVYGERGTYEQRDFALDLAIFAQDEHLLADVCEVALDPDAPLDLRQTAAFGVITFGLPALRARLKPLIAEVSDDPTERLNWLGMYAAWPTALTPAELFAALATRKRRSRLQTYSVFPVDEIAAGFTRETVPRGLAWAARREARLGTTYRTQRADAVADDLVDALLVRAWELFDEDATVAEGFARVAWSRLRRYDPIVGSLRGREFAEALRSNAPRRHAFAERLIRRCMAPETDSNRVLVSDPRLLTSEDLPWITEKLTTVTMEHERATYAMALVRLADVARPDDFACVSTALDVSPIVRAHFGWTREVVAINSARAGELRRAHAAAEAARQKQEAATRRGPSLELLRQTLQRVTTTPAAWWEFARLLTLSDAHPDFGEEYEHDLTVLPGWAKLDADDYARAIAAAETYLLYGDAEPATWLGLQVFHRPAAGGVKALSLLAKLAPERFAMLPQHIWQRWALAIVGVSTNHAEIPLLREAYAHAPDEVLRTVDTLIDAENRQSGDVLIVRYLAPIWDDRIAARLIAHVDGGMLSENARARLIETLIEKRYEPARTLAEGALTPLPGADAANRAWGRRMAVLLLTHAPDHAWQTLRSVLIDDAFGREVITVTAHEDRFRGAVLARLSDDQLGALFTLVAGWFPLRTDPQHTSGVAFSPSLRDDIATWRNMVLTTLMNRGTASAVAVIRAAAEALPEERYLIRALREAEAKRRHEEWRPVSIPQLLALAGNTDLRFVESATQLADVLLESLDRLRLLLHGDTPLVGFLWNEMRVKQVMHRRPKTETQLSDFIKVFLDLDLRRRGIVVNREVQIRPPVGRGTGEITDIHVDAVRIEPEPTDRITTVVEVKGCWNAELLRAMRTQLRDRYLQGTPDHTGVYCVGWFQCDAWDTTDPRKRAMRGTSMKAIASRLAAQARRLAPSGRIRAAVLDLRLPTALVATRQSRARRSRPSRP